jgi:SPP1 gp7 family putative phage head morphogenesis protein
MDRERRRIEMLAITGSTTIGLRLRRRALTAFRKGHDVSHVIRSELEEMLLLLTDSMTMAHMLGAVRSVRVAEDHRRKIRREFRRAHSAVAEAFDVLRLRAGLDAAGIEALQAAHGEIASGAISGMGRAVDKAVEQAVATSIRQTFDGMGLQAPKPYRLEALYRTQLQTAYSAGRMQANRDPATQDILWGYEYSAVGDDRTRPNHAALDGTRLPKDSPRWDTITPPNGFNCRCVLIEIFNDDAELASDHEPEPLEIDGQTIPGAPDQGFDFNPGDIAADVTFPETFGAPV